MRCVLHPASSFPNSALILGQIRIRDPNQGGKDITEEIMSGARTSSTPTPPQVSEPSDFPAGAEGSACGPVQLPLCPPQAGSGLEPQANGETPHVAVVVRPGKCPCQGWVCQLAGLQQGSLVLALQDVKCQPHCSLVPPRLVGSEAIPSYLGTCVPLLDPEEFMGAVHSPQLSPGCWRTPCCSHQPFVMGLGKSVPISLEDRGI